MIEVIFRTLPETFIVLFGIHVICRERFRIPKNIIICMVLSTLVFLVRLLPIYFGVHMIINIILTISVIAFIGVPIIKSIYSTFLVYFMLSLCEGMNVVVLKLLNVDAVNVFSNPLEKCIYGIPSLVALLICIVIINYLLRRKGNVDNVSY